MQSNKPQDQEQSMGIGDALRWYFSPYLTTLITAPMLLVLLGTGLFAAIRVIGRAIALASHYPLWCLLGAPGTPLVGLHLFLVYWVVMGIPRLWKRYQWTVLKRLLAISGAFVGVLVAVIVIDSIMLLIHSALIGVPPAESALVDSWIRPAESSPIDTWTRPADDMVMVYVPGGEFQMGSTDAEVDEAVQLCKDYYLVDCRRGLFEGEQPKHTVVLDAFWIDRTEVTNAQYARCVADGDCEESKRVDDPDFDGADYPVVGVDWHNAATYCEWARARLPTEAEWEYAARGTERRIFPWGDNFDGTRLNFCDIECPYDYRAAKYADGHRYTAQVGSYPGGASWCGGLDLAGNVWEWVADWHDVETGYPSGRQVNPTGPASGGRKRMRGGSWADHPSDVRSAMRYSSIPSMALPQVGFRCARGSQ